MDIERIARKLEPLRPRQVRHWLHLRSVGDAALKATVDQQIVRSARKLLGDFEIKPLFSLPPKKLAAGEFRLGTVLYESEKWAVGLSRGELLQNLAIFGRSGAGKTNVTFHLLQQLATKGIPFLFLDWKRTARHLLPSLRSKVNLYTPGRRLAPFVFNPFVVPPGLEPNVYVNHVVDILADAYTLGDGARSVLQRSIAACYDRGMHAPTVRDILKELDNIPDHIRVRGWKLTAERALQSLDYADLSSSKTQSQHELARSLLESNTIVELDGLSQGGKQFLVPILCLWLYYVRLAAAQREKLKLVIFVEEAHHVLYRGTSHSKETVMNMLLRQCREIGIAMVVVDQHPHLTASAALGNVYTSICLNLKDPADINRAAGLSMLGEDDKKYLTQLPVGQGVVKLQDRWRQPFLVRFPLVNVAKGAVTDDVLKRLLSGDLPLSALKRAVRNESADDARSRFHDEPPSNTDWSLMEDVLRYPDDGVDRRYKRLGVSADKGHRTKMGLLSRGWLEQEDVRVGRTHRMMLRLTSSTKQALGLDDGPHTPESIAHAYWKRWYADRLTESGFSVQVETAISGGRVDVLARKNGESVAIEIETGKSDFAGNVRRALKARIRKITVVATDLSAMAHIERLLLDKGLLIAGRVDVVPAGTMGLLTKESLGTS